MLSELKSQNAKRWILHMWITLALQLCGTTKNFKFHITYRGVHARITKGQTLAIMGDFPCPRQFTSEASSQLEIMKLEFCESLLHWSLNLVSLRLLTIDWCPTLVSFPEASFPPMLRSIRIGWCMALILCQMLFTAMHVSRHGNFFLQFLVSVGIGQIPPTLKCLEIRNCQNLQSLLDEEEGSFSSDNTSNLEYLQICHCYCLKSLCSGRKFPPRLKELHIQHCLWLESIAERFGNTSLKQNDPEEDERIAMRKKWILTLKREKQTVAEDREMKRNKRIKACTMLCVSSESYALSASAAAGILFKDKHEVKKNGDIIFEPNICINDWCAAFLTLLSTDWSGTADH
ncbi:hypothetical protein GH714_004187 [Hevea brasiliensis]|uniref:Uncharacterized protein n=1 Tax=Hevea brasiliensis TaxID=3981 RepID=A0A6A6KXF4_HEVBR|nr:hypothetical protein GH714_004187 [Hevea brasiliensis]